MSFIDHIDIEISQELGVLTTMAICNTLFVNEIYVKLYSARL